jgi:hypothetical protein
MKDLGISFDFVSYDQVEKGRLSADDYRVFILPLSMAISEEEAAEIVSFAEKGGVVIADLAAGVMNDHCTWREEGLLAELFGIAAAPSSEREYTGAAGDVEVTVDGYKWGLYPEELAGIEAAEAGLGVAGGTALAKVGDTPIIVVRPVGNGWAIYLNVSIEGYGRARRRDYGGANYRALVRALLDTLDVRPEVEVIGADGKPLDRALIARYKIGDSRVIAIVKENIGVQEMQTFDGVTVYEDGDLGEVASQAITVRLDKAAYVSDVRAGERLGFSEAIKTSVPVGGATVLALSPTDNEIAVEGPVEAVRGEHVTFAITSQSVSKRVLRCHFFAPDGSFAVEYAKNITVEGGKATLVFPTALSDAAGEWSLTVTDLLTGASAEAAIELR